MPFLDTPARGVGGAVSGRIGSTIYAHGPSGPYKYEFTPRVDPDTPEQRRAREWFSIASSNWTTTSPAVRASWDRYADNVRRPTAVGKSGRPTGQNYYVGTFMLQAFIYIPYNPWAPTVFTLGRCGTPWFQVFAGAFILVRFDPDDEWLHHYDGGFALFTSRPQPLTVNYFRGPYRYAGSVTGGMGGPPYQALFRPAFYPTPTPCKLFLRARAIEADNRLSPNVYDVLTFT